MKKFILFSLTLLLTICFNEAIRAQTQSKGELEEEAYHAFGIGEYPHAYTLFDQLSAKYPKEFDYRFKLGVICLYYPEKKERAIEIFSEMKKDSKGPDIDYYLGKAYHHNYKFKEAVPFLQAFIAAKEGTKKKEEIELLADAKHTIENCDHGIFLIDNKITADIINVGRPINTDALEGSPIITTDESIIIFTYAGKKSMGGKLNDQLKPDPEGHYLEDIFISEKFGDTTFSEPRAIESVNTLGNDAAIAISPDGSTMFTFASNNDEGDIYVSYLVGHEWTKPEPLNKNINTDAWEGSCSISADGRHLYFASERPGGLGGRDIWMSTLEKSDWGPAVNLGPNINTKWNDDAPFIHPDGVTLFFSSQGHQSIGGYDIMYSHKRDNDWLPPQSMGMPLNTTEDDRYYVINSRGDKGYFSSNRSGSGGKGNQDIYMVTPGILGEKPIIALLKGTVFGNDIPMEGKIEVVKLVENEFIGPFHSNAETGKYLTALSPGYVYRLTVSAPKYDSIVEDLDIAHLDKYVEAHKDFYLYTPGTVHTHTNVPINISKDGTVVNSTVAVTPTIAVTPTVVPTETVAVTPTVAPTETTAVVTPTIENVVTEVPCSASPLPDFTPLKGKSLNDIQNYNELLKTAGDYCADGMVFKVQIGAYRKPQNFKYKNLIQFGKPEIVDYPDGITRFTQKEFKTIKEAEVQRQKSIAKGQKDAWIVAFVNGKRYTLEELIMVDFLGKAIN